MSMTELERRCAFVLQNLDETWDNPSCGRSYEEIARAVLAEAGVAELVEALTELLASGNDYLHPDTLHIIAKRNTGETIGDIVNAALAKIGANQ